MDGWNTFSFPFWDPAYFQVLSLLVLGFFRDLQVNSFTKVSDPMWSRDRTEGSFCYTNGKLLLLGWGAYPNKKTQKHIKKKKHIIGFGVVWIQVFVNLINYFMCSLFHSLLFHSCNKSVSQHKLHFCSVSLAYSSRLYHLHMFCDAMIDMTYTSRYRNDIEYIYIYVCISWP